MFKNRIFHCLLTLLFINVNIQCQFNNNGNVSVRNYEGTGTLTNHGNIDAQNISNDGEIQNFCVISGENLDIECTKISGNGLIKGNNITIYTKDFNFLGSIDCKKECTIITPNTITPKFRKIGGGRFIFKTDKNLKFSWENLMLSQWKDALYQIDNYLIKKNILPLNEYNICRVLVQIDARKKVKNSIEWKNLIEKIKSINEMEANKAYNELIRVINENKEGFFKLLKIDSDVKILKRNEIKNIKELDNDRKSSPINIGFLIFYDPQSSVLNELSKEKTIGIDTFNLLYKAINLETRRFLFKLFLFLD